VVKPGCVRGIKMIPNTQPGFTTAFYGAGTIFNCALYHGAVAAGPGQLCSLLENSQTVVTITGYIIAAQAAVKGFRWGWNKVRGFFKRSAPSEVQDPVSAPKGPDTDSPGGDVSAKEPVPKKRKLVPCRDKKYWITNTQNWLIARKQEKAKRQEKPIKFVTKPDKNYIPLNPLRKDVHKDVRGKLGKHKDPPIPEAVIRDVLRGLAPTEMTH
jgi:hypothetical protein